MNKLGSKEIFLILVIINFLLYYFAYMFVISPMRKAGEDYKGQAVSLEEQYKADKTVVDSKDQYISDIKNLKEEKKELFNNSFPDAETESVHAYLVKKTAENGLTMDNISINQQVSTVRNEETGEEFPTGLKTNTISLQIKGAYDNIIKLIAAMEAENKTSLLTSLSLSGSAGSMNTSINYSLMTVDKGDDIKDTTLDHTFNNGVGDIKLFK